MKIKDSSKKTIEELYTVPRDKAFIGLVCVMFCQKTLFDYFAVIIGKLPIISIYKGMFFPILYVLLVIFSYSSKRIEYLRFIDICMIFFFALFFYRTFVFNNENVRYIMLDLKEKILPCIPFFLLGLCIKFDKKEYEYIGICNCIAVFISFIYLFYFIGSGRSLGGSHGEDYSMYWAYLLLPNTLISMEYAFQSKKKYAVICSILGIIYAFSMGTRGAIIVIFVFLGTCIWRYANISIDKKIILVIIVSILIYFFINTTFYIELLTTFREWLFSCGVSTRIVDYMINGKMVSNMSGRDVIYQNLLEKLKSNLIWGYGMYGEYAFGYTAGAHNILLQIVFNFGYPLGILLIISYTVVFIKGLIHSKGRLEQGWIVLFGCLVFVKGLCGSSYLDYPVFFLLGLCLKEIRASRERIIDNKNKERTKLYAAQKSNHNIRKIL